MKINRYVIVILLLVLLTEGLDATYSVWGLRRLITEAPSGNTSLENIPPVPSPVSNVKERKANPTDGDMSAKGKPIPSAKDQKASPADGDTSTNNKPKDDLHAPNDAGKSNPNSSNENVNKTSTAGDGDKSTNNKPKEGLQVSNDPGKTNPKSSNENDSKTSTAGDGDEPTNKKPKEDLQVSNDPGKTNPKSSNENDNKTSTAGSPTESSGGNGKKDVQKERNDGNEDSKSGTNGSCEGSIEPCRLLKSLTACIQSLESGSKELALLIQNEGESNLTVHISMLASRTNVGGGHVISVKQTETIHIPPSVMQGSKILLKAGDEECTLLVGQATFQSNFLRKLPSYYKQITPIYIAYFIFLVALIVGGTCACCQLRKRKRHDGVPYQELEMGVSETVSANNIETADGWDDGWDDDWDDDKAVKSPGHRAVGISANGLTARPSKQDGWGKDWDD